MSAPLTITREFHVARRSCGRMQLCQGAAPPATPAGRVPRVARLMALAIRCDALLRDGLVANQSELAALGHVSTARMTQIMALLNLAPDLQEKLLFLPRTARGTDAVTETELRPIVAAIEWRKQRRMWAELERRFERNDASSR